MTKILVWNCNGSFATSRAVTDMLRITKAEVIILTEAHNCQFKNKQRGWKSIAAIAKKNNKSRHRNGILILYRNNININKISRDHTHGRWIKFNLNFEGRSLNCLAIYAPASYSEKNKFWSQSEVIPLIKRCDMVLGDFNFELDATYKRSDFTKKVESSVRQLFEPFNDAAVDLQDTQPTYGNISRIDRILYKKSVSVVSNLLITRMPVDRLDHLALIVDVHHSHVSEQWRFKSFLIIDEEDKEMVASVLNCPASNWEDTKRRMIQALKSVEERILKRRRRAFYQAQALLKRFPNSKNVGRWKIKIRQLDETIRKATRLWIRCQQATARELPNSWLTSKIRSRAKQKKIAALKNPVTKVIAESDSEIVEAFRAHYEKLYSSVPISNSVLSEMLSKWSPDELLVRRMAKPIDEEEVEKAISNMKSKKAPGRDGISNVAYKMMSGSCQTVLRKQLNQFLEGEEIPPHWKVGTIVQLYKGDTATDPGNYRPITLLNTDYKILCSIMAARMNLFITKLIPNYQIGFMPRRLIYDNVLCLGCA